MTKTNSPNPGSDQSPAEAPGSSEVFLGAGQTLWLAVVTVVSVAALALAIIAVVLVYDDDDGGSSSEGASSDDSSSEGSSSGSDSGSDSSAPTSVDLSAIEFAFEPGSVTVEAGSDVEINVLNDGAVDHELVILNAGERITAEADFDESMVLDRTKVLEAGASDSITVNLEPGTYQIVCLVPGHFSAGMEDELEAS